MSSSRDKRQDAIVDQWGTSPIKGRGTLLATTGFGKTRTLIKAALRVLKSNPQAVIKVIVPTNLLKKQWEKELTAYKIPDFEVVVINTAIKKQLKCDLLLLDEIHLYRSTEFGKIFKTVQYKWVFGATATLDDKDKMNLIETYCPVFHRVTLKECKENHWVSDFTIYNLGIELNKEDRVVYNAITKKFNKYFLVFEYQFDTATECAKKSGEPTRLRLLQKYLGIEGRPQSEQAYYIMAIQFMRVMRQRTNFIYNCSAKLDVAKRIIEKFPDRNIITFSQTIDFAERLTEMLPHRAIAAHSKMGKKQFKEAVNKVINPETQINVLNTAKAFDVGVDFPFVDMSVVLASTSTTRQALQRTGRIIRYVQGKHAMEVNIYIKDSQEERWVRRKQKESVSMVYIDSIDEIV